MDAVILAAGKGSRLEGVMAPYMKPLMVINARAVVWTAVHHAIQVGANQVTVVVAPENALPISQILHREEWDARLQILVQPSPNGPGDALYRALKIAHSSSTVERSLTRDKTLVLMGDNVSTFADVQAVNAVPDFAVGVQYMTFDEAHRFTRYRTSESRWVEGEAMSELDRDSTGRDVLTRMVPCWVGPFVCSSERMMTSISKLRARTPVYSEVKIGPAFNYVGLEPMLVPTTTIDIGTPETVHGV